MKNRRTTSSPCIICIKPFQENQKIIFCPDCGEPYHNDDAPINCWKRIGKKCKVKGCNGSVHPAWEKIENVILQNFRVGKSDLVSICPICGAKESYLNKYCTVCGHLKNSPSAIKTYFVFPVAKWVHNYHSIVATMFSLLVILGLGWGAFSFAEFIDDVSFHNLPQAFLETEHTQESMVVPSNTTKSMPTKSSPLPSKTPTRTPKPLTPTGTSTEISSSTNSQSALASHEILKKPTPLDRYVKNIRITYYDKFNTFQVSDWDYYPENRKPTVSEGKLSIPGLSGWKTGLFFTGDKINVGEGILLVYSYSDNANFEFKLEQGEWRGNDYKRWGVQLQPLAWSESYKTNVYDGFDQIGLKNLEGRILLFPENLYCMFLGVDESGKLFTLIWKKNKPNEFLYSGYRNPQWPASSWEFAISGDKGVVDVTSITLINFDN